MVRNSEFDDGKSNDSAGATDLERLPFDRAIEAFDRANRDDPNSLEWKGERTPKELLHSKRASYWVEKLAGDPSESLLLAARAHHLRRWCSPRSDFPEGRAGYYAWRRAQGARHAEEAGEILKGLGFSESTIARVGQIIRKEGLGRDPEVQTLEDALCLIFLETQLDVFADRHPEEKVVGVIARSLRKMSPEGRALGVEIDLSVRGKALLGNAIREYEG